MKRQFCYFYLTCEPGNEQVIADTLLNEHLVACAKFVPITSSYWWNGKIEKANETSIILESASDLFSEVERVVTATITGYDTFVLAEVPMKNVNKDAAKWLNESLKEAA